MWLDLSLCSSYVPFKMTNVVGKVFSLLRFLILVAVTPADRSDGPDL